MKKVLENSPSSASILGLNLSPKTRKFISWVWLSVWLLIGWNGQAQAYMWMSPTLKNSIFSPVYSWLSLNIWNSDRTSKPEKWLKNLNENSLTILVKSNIWIQEEDLKKVNTLFIEYLSKVYENKEIKSWFWSFIDMIDIAKKEGINEIQALQIINIYIKNWYIPENISQRVLISVINFYSPETLLLKIAQVETLHKEGKEISQESIYPIFKEYFDTESEKSSENIKLMLASILWGLLLSGLFTWLELRSK